LEARLELCRCFLSRGWIHEGGEPDCATALAMARRVLQDDPTSVTGLVVAGAALVGMDRPEAAEKYLNQAVAVEPDRADLNLALGALSAQLGEPRPSPGRLTCCWGVRCWPSID
jgi:hypothetical protein